MAIGLLARREHSRAELSRKLNNKKFSATDILDALERLEKEGLLSDHRFTNAFIHYRSQRGYGPLKIRAELIARGIADELIEHSLDPAGPQWFLTVRHVWQKRFKNCFPGDFMVRAKQMRFLQYRGFTQDQIESILREKK